MNIDKLILNFLEEDIGEGDITSSILPEISITASIISKEKGIIAGVNICKRLFELMDCSSEILIDDGSRVKNNDIIMKVKGNAQSILSSERTALNIMMRMSGIATLTRKYIDAVREVNDKVMIAGTRKTAPGLRYLDKRAIEIGNGYSHRYRLDEMILIKDNHLAITGSVKDAIELVKKRYNHRYTIEVEVETLDDAIEAIEEGADMIMLDNLSSNEVHNIISALKKRGLRDKVKIEVSGGVNLDNVREYAKADIDIISIGSITHSVKSLDLSLEVSL